MSEGSAMLWASAQARGPEAATEVVAALRGQLGEGGVDLCLAFVSGAMNLRLPQAVRELRAAFAPGCIAGATAHGTVGTAHEVEGSSSLSVIVARLPGVTVAPFLLSQESWAEPIEDEAAFDTIAPGVRGAEILLLLGEPHTMNAERVLALVNRFAPGVRVVGGMCSVPGSGSLNMVVLNDWESREGGVAIALHGAIRADVVVSQGCAPIGPPLDVTHVERNMLLTLDGQPALERIEHVLAALPDSERARLDQGLYVGRPARGDASGRGDYLIRQLLGADRERGAVAVGDLVGPREKIRLHVRDARAATEDLEMLLSPQAFDTRAAAALVFSCNGRGKGLFGVSDQDITTLQESLGGIPAAGMFCAGEIGPVGERNFLHGHTASIAILRAR